VSGVAGLPAGRGRLSAGTGSKSCPVRSGPGHSDERRSRGLAPTAAGGAAAAAGAGPAGPGEAGRWSSSNRASARSTCPCRCARPAQTRGPKPGNTRPLAGWAGDGRGIAIGALSPGAGDSPPRPPWLLVQVRTSCDCIIPERAAARQSPPITAGRAGRPRQVPCAGPCQIGAAGTRSRMPSPKTS
jgi:hypothetical protein